MKWIPKWSAMLSKEGIQYRGYSGAYATFRVYKGKEFVDTLISVGLDVLRPEDKLAFIIKAVKGNKRKIDFIAPPKVEKDQNVIDAEASTASMKAAKKAREDAKPKPKKKSD